ncbi:MAG: biosynthetic arginine decarboxylase, partial [Mariprofundaceae bacterium]
MTRREAAWTPRDAAALYRIEDWGKGFFRVNAAGHIEATPDGRLPIDLAHLCDELAARGLHPPLLLRFSDILRRRMGQIHERFERARAEAEYEGRYFGVYPVKVNQQRQVVEEIIEFGAAFEWGLEAGSKPELHAVLALLDEVEGPVVCNGYKDREFVELAMIGRKLGKRMFVVVEKTGELELILAASRAMGVRPLIGLRCRLAANSEGKWEDSGGDRSKFGLSAEEIVRVVARLREEGMLDCLQLLHFHIGSQVPRIRRIKQAMAEAARFYVELRRQGAPIAFMDVGGGLGVNYDGSFSGSEASVDYSLQEYANDIVWTMKSVCDEAGLPHPHIISESGRALTAHHAVLIVDVLGVARRAGGNGLAAPSEASPLQLRQLWNTWEEFEAIDPREALHDAVSLREDVHRLFALGHCSLADRALADDLYWHLLDRLAGVLDEAEIDEIVPGARLWMADRYFCNFSLFQSLPDAWAIRQVFPVAPIQRLDAHPEREAVLVDITCDSDGKLQQFPLAGGHAPTLPLHAPRNGEPYRIGIFLVGAYQEILGDLHNLFGDTHAVHVRVDGDQYELEQVVEGESVA